MSVRFSISFEFERLCFRGHAQTASFLWAVSKREMELAQFMYVSTAVCQPGYIDKAGPAVPNAWAVP